MSNLIRIVGLFLLWNKFRRILWRIKQVIERIYLMVMLDVSIDTMLRRSFGLAINQLQVQDQDQEGIEIPYSTYPHNRPVLTHKNTQLRRKNSVK